jgi:hypothetical protein
MSTHVLALIVGFFIALLVVSPHIRAWQIVGSENFEGIYPAFNDDEITYQARIKEALDGHSFIGNPYIKEHADDSFIMPPVAEWFVASVAWFTNTSVPFVTSTSDFFLAFLNFLLVYALFLILTKRNKWMALFYTTIFFVFSLGAMGRPVSPQLNAVPMFLGLIVIAKLHFENGGEMRKWNILAGLFTGITCFFYPYFFTTLLVLYGVLMMSGVFIERSIEPIKKHVPWFLYSFVPFASLYIFFQLQAGQDAFYTETLARYGLFHTYLPGSFTNVALAVLAGGVLVVAFRMLNMREIAFGGSIVLSIVILNWQNVITGASLQFSSHYQLTTVLSVLMVLALVNRALETVTVQNLLQPKRLVVAFSILFVLLVLAENRKEEYLNIALMPHSKAELLEQQKDMEVFDWFNTHTEPDSVVYTLGGSYDFLLPVYTKNKVFYNFYAALYPASNSETEERWLVQHIFDERMSTSTIRDRQRDFWGNRFIDSYQSNESRRKIRALLTRSEYVPLLMVDEQYIDEMFKRWTQMNTKPIQEVLGKYTIDYILLSRDYPDFENVRRRIEAMGGLELVGETNRVLVYSL